MHILGKRADFPPSNIILSVVTIPMEVQWLYLWDESRNMPNSSDRYPKHTLELFPGFIWIKFLDEVNGRSVRKSIELFIDLSATRNISRFISDSRGCALDYPVMERYEVGKYWAEKVSPDIFVASIVDESHWSGLVENVASNRGGRNLMITTNEAKALEWIRSR